MSPKYKAFYAQRYRAKQRGIGWCFTFEEWCQWWEQQLGPNWFSKRGCHRGQYCMARKRDKGIYIIGNVECILHDQNMRDTRVNGTSRFGERHGMHKLTEQDVIEIRQIRSTLHIIAKVYGVSPSLVRQIKTRIAWKHLSGPITPAIDRRGIRPHKPDPPYAT